MPAWGGWCVFLHQTLLLVSVVVPATTLAQTPSVAPVSSAVALSASNNDTSKGLPWCQWVAQEALECHIRTLEDSLGSQVAKGHWQDRNDTSGIPAAGQWPRDQVPGLPGAWAARSDTRHLRVLSVECSQVLYYQSRLTARTFQVRLGCLSWLCVCVGLLCPKHMFDRMLPECSKRYSLSGYV